MTQRVRDSEAPAPSFGAGAIVAERYRVTRTLGRGAAGVVYAARRIADDAEVALKVIHPELCHSRQIFGRYKREAEILRRLDHKQIVRFFDFVEHGELLAIVIELVPGVSLERLLQEQTVDVELACEIVIQICQGLEAAHAAGIIHRDLKPANVMVERPQRGEVVVRILDFGLAKGVHGGHLVTGLTERDMIFGTPEYMAPEQARGDEVDVRCDVYACGVMLYQLVTGTVPLRGRTPFATMTAQLTEAIEPPRARAPDRRIPSALEAVILRALEKEAEKRYLSARALREAIEGALERRVVSVNPRSDDDMLHDTELAMRRSQIHKATGLLDEAKALATKNAAERVASTPAPAPQPAAGPAWLWPAIAGLAIVTCVVLGVLLALK